MAIFFYVAYENKKAKRLPRALRALVMTGFLYWRILYEETNITGIFGYNSITSTMYEKGKKHHPVLASRVHPS